MSRYDRQMILPEIGPAGQARLGAARVVIIGAGGLGATVIPALAGAGVGQLTIVDHDHIDEGNLHRQTLFRMSDLGQLKAVVTAREMAALNPGIAVLPVIRRLDPANAGALLDGVDLVIDAADSFAVSYILSDACLAAGLPLISASVLGRQGYVGAFCGGAPSLRALFPELPERAGTCATTGVMGPVVAMLGALQAQMALAVLLGHRPAPLGQLLSLDLARWHVSTLRFGNASEPVDPLRFISRSAVMDADCVVELRDADESPPVTAQALRIAPQAIAGWHPPQGRRVVLTCASGLRAWRAARDLQSRGHRDLALIAAG